MEVTDFWFKEKGALSAKGSSYLSIIFALFYVKKGAHPLPQRQKHFRLEKGQKGT
jgi:hypothetical protein